MMPETLCTLQKTCRGGRLQIKLQETEASLRTLFLSSFTDSAYPTYPICFYMQNPQSPSASLSSLCPPCRHLCIVLKDFFRLKFYHTNAVGVKKKIPQTIHAGHHAKRPPAAAGSSAERVRFSLQIPCWESPVQPPDPLLEESGSASRSSAGKTGCIMYCFSTVFRKTARGRRKRMDYFYKYRKNLLSPKNFR